MTSHELRILSVKSRKENLRWSREHELRIWNEAEKKKFTGETVRVRDIQYYREGELEWGRELCSSNIRVMIWSRPKRHFFFFYTRNLYDTVLRGSRFNFSVLVGRKFQLWSITSTYLFLCFLFYAIILFLYYNPSSPFL